jgi:uncharacterized membrane protein YdbT with pleckstrin-like domain
MISYPPRERFPMSEILEYPYRPNPRTMFVGIAFFGVAAAVLANTAATNDRGLILDGIITLGVEGATRFYGSLAFAAVLFAVAAALGLKAGRSNPRFVRLTATEISAPKNVFSRQPTVVPLDRIQGIDVQEIKKQRMLNIYHAQGSLTVVQSMLPGPAAFDELHGTLVSSLQHGALVSTAQRG